MKRFGDEAQSWYERNVAIGRFELKTDPVSLSWQLGCDASESCFKYRTTMFVHENTGDNRLAGMFVERSVRMGEWYINGKDCCKWK